MVMAELLYYTRDRNIPIVIWDADGAPGNQYEMTAPLTTATSARVLYVTSWSEPGAILSRFAAAQPLPTLTVPDRPGRSRTFYMYDLDGYQGR
jgi:hypothetical protein